MSASLLCALHCTALPALLTLAPFVGLAFLSAPWVEWTMIILAAGVAVPVLGSAYRSHRRSAALWLAAAGFGSIALGHLLLHHTGWEAAGTGLGGFAIAAAHLLNWRWTRRVQGCALPYPHAHTHTHAHATETPEYQPVSAQ
ncbi:MAG: hypothetical protein OHK0039_18560 [Bacteroidia bacterium]